MRRYILNLLRILIGLTLFMGGIFSIASTLNKMNNENVNTQRAEQLAIDELKNKYAQLNIGMTYDECVSIIGCNGELFSETETEYSGKYSVYLWKP